ncbi:MAG: alpha/beta fold hydrolase [cyanobacterium endosymbiont of Rhopalodia musculus]|uniref:alpha/beta fold hydrolase n=1 Tax=cyanobacterium endosymbiont of Epithemia clementina EcSB TaxID=3034674 RepID=UPI00248044E4|nr:alpha/beta hydrolase [cyanobacterium endosymbiont of Epithemia clementina EcSB]WGT67596.1 alpha/beta hydrolase [cyanobacterium endosymbiont of Epithemia clementina EcSB]
MPTIDILGVPHAYELTSPSFQPSTPVLIFIHGWLLSRQYWLPLIEQLAPNYPCLIYDLRGFGDSQQIRDTLNRDRVIDWRNSFQRANPSLTNGSSPYALGAYAQDLSVLLQKFAIKRAWLIGHSLGGSIALWGADVCPETVQGVICLNSGGGIYLKEEFERFRLAGELLIKRRPGWLSYVPLIDVLFSRLMIARPLERRWGRQRVLDLLKADPQAALGSLLDSTTETEVHLLPQIVSRLQQPVYFLAGDKDTVMEPKYVRYLASFHPLFEVQGSNVIELANCGHMSMVEQPEILGEKMLKILMSHS